MKLAPVIVLAALTACHRSGDDKKPAPTPSVTTVPQAPPLVVASDPSLERKPKIAVYERDPWAMVIGSEVPAVVVYDDGTVIRKQREGRVEAPKALIDRVSSELLPVAERQSIYGATDQPTTTIVVDTGKGWILRSVYGMAPGCRAKGRDKAATGFQSSCEALRDLKLSGEHAYHPETLEVMLWGYEHAPGDPKPWPASLPDPPKVAPPKSGTVKHRIPGRYQSELDAFLGSLASRQPVGFNGHKWSVAYRVAVPGDVYLYKVQQELWRAQSKR